jgi:hypothetical protein
MKKIGRLEKVFFPKLLEGFLTAKIDTGAFNASLHVDSIKELENQLEVKIGNNTYHFCNWSEIEVKSSNGEKQKRYAIKTKIIIGQKKYSIFVSLSNRKEMKYPLLIGRRFLHVNDFVVDVKKKNHHGRPKKV